jgi:hypothetical protein
MTEEKDPTDFFENLWEGIEILGERVKDAKKFVFDSDFFI